jgi:hypothetical protein
MHHSLRTSQSHLQEQLSHFETLNLPPLRLWKTTGKIFPPSIYNQAIISQPDWQLLRSTNFLKVAVRNLPQIDLADNQKLLLYIYFRSAFSEVRDPEILHHLLPPLHP